MRETANLFALSLAPESSYGVPLTASGSPKNYEQIAKEGYDGADYQVNPVTNAGMSTGTPYPTKSTVGNHDVTQQFNERMTFQAIGRRLLAMLGGYQVTTVSTGVYKHTFTPLNPHLEVDLPSYTYVEKLGEPALAADILHEVLYPGFKMESGSLNNPPEADNGAFLMLSSSWRGSGKQLGSPVASQTGVGVNFVNTTVHVVGDAEKTENFIKSTAAVVNLYPNASLGGTAQEIGCDFRGFSFNHNNNLLVGQGYQGCGKFQDQTNAESGAVRGSLPAGVPTTDLAFTALVKTAMAQTFNPMKRLREQSVFSLKLDWVGDIIPTTAVNFSLTFKASKLTAKTVKIGQSDTLDTFEIAAETLSPGMAQPYSFELVNNIASYLTL